MIKSGELKWDLETEGSRFTSRVAVSVVPGEQLASRFENGSSNAAAETVSELLGENAAADQDALGPATIVNASIGRGAAGWAPALEWAITAAVAGLVGNAAWDVTHAAARAISARVRSWNGLEAKILVSRGSAALLAIDYVLRTTDELGPIDIEFVSEPSSLRGRPISELSYVGLEPWMVSLINASRTTRFVAAVQPDGSIAGCISIPMNEFESFFSEFPQRDD